MAVVVMCCWLAGVSAGQEDEDMPALSPQHFRDFSIDDMRRFIHEAGPKVCSS
ncbi:hypothetical protein E2C01_096163 [Portunus trituberculatus]|uniref:Uncharacterized protein n=1 Tax=Portunus trituberculatus TaxID=210409 RepID=A0A5B7K7J4_PORTR|nr:hypothetical protein [Portunus trituberculatus]